MTHRRWSQNVIERAVVVLGVLTLSACGSQHSNSATAPSSISESASPTNVMQTNGAPELLTVSADVTVTAIVPGTTCPSMQFKVNTYVFKTSADTQYVSGTCASVRAGTKVSVSGTRPNNSELLVYVSKAIMTTEATPAPAPPAPVPGSATTSGTATGIASGFTCPAADTGYDGDSCSDVKPRKPLFVQGVGGGEKAVLATRVAFED